MRAPRSASPRRSRPPRARRWRFPRALFGAAFIFALAAITALAVGVVLALAKLHRAARRRLHRHGDLRGHCRRPRLVWRLQRLRRDL